MLGQWCIFPKALGEEGKNGVLEGTGAEVGTCLFIDYFNKCLLIPALYRFYGTWEIQYCTKQLPWSHRACVSWGGQINRSWKERYNLIWSMKNNKWNSVGTENNYIYSQHVVDTWVCFKSTDGVLLSDGVTCEQSSGAEYQPCENLRRRFPGRGKSEYRVVG